MDNGQTPGGNTTTAGAVEQLARRIADAHWKTGTYSWEVAKISALAAILETREDCARIAESVNGSQRVPNWPLDGKEIAAAIRAGGSGKSK